MPPSRREELVDTAMRVFCEHGSHASGLERVLEVGGISRMTVYNHFKSKDELIVAALRRRDEIFRNRLMKFVETATKDPIGRILSVFDFHEQWFTSPEFFGCMFINAAAEFPDPQSGARLIAAGHKRAIVRYLAELCRAANLAEPDERAEELNLLVEGAIVMARVVGQTGIAEGGTGIAARRAKGLARNLLDAAARH